MFVGSSPLCHCFFSFVVIENKHCWMLAQCQSLADREIPTLKKFIIHMFMTRKLRLGKHQHLLEEQRYVFGIGFWIMDFIQEYFQVLLSLFRGNNFSSHWFNNIFPVNEYLHVSWCDSRQSFAPERFHWIHLFQRSCLRPWQPIQYSAVFLEILKLELLLKWFGGLIIILVPRILNTLLQSFMM